MFPQIEAPAQGKLTEAELDSAIASNVIPLHRGFVAWDGDRCCPPCHGNCEQGDACPHRLQPQAAEAATAVGHTEPRSKWSPAVNVVLIIAAFSIATAMAIVKASKPAMVIWLCVALPLLAVAVVNLLTRWKG